MDIVIGLPISTNWKGDSYDFILVIVDWLSKMVHHKPMKVTIDVSRLAKVIIDIVVCYHGFPDSIVTNRGSLFTLKFWSSLCYFFSIKHEYLPHSSLRLTVKQSNKTARWRLTSNPLSTLSKMTELGSYQWPSSFITMPKT